MNVLIVVPSLMRAGAETQAVDLANGLAANGHTVHLCSFESQLDQLNRLSSDVRFHHAPRRRKYDTFLISTIAGLIDRERIDVIQGVLLFAVLVAWLSAKRSSRTPPVVAGVHTTVNRSLKQELQDRILYRRLLCRLPAVLFVCNHQRDHWISKYPELGPIAHVVHNGIEISRYQRDSLLNPARQLRVELGIPSTAFVFSCIAGFRREKGHRLLISAFARQDPASYLLLAGQGHERPSIEAMVREHDLGDRVRFLGMVSDVRPLIVASDATVLASTAVETFSIAMLESMALGVPLIASRIGGLPEAIIPGETGLLFPIGDVDALTAGMSSMIDSNMYVRRMGHAAEKLVRAAYTLERMIDGNERVLREVVATWRTTVVA
jgi:glycosyltransferase involved in cell wall biosynthesis